MHQVLVVTLYILAVLGVVAAFAAIVAATAAYIGPRIQLIASGQLRHGKGYAECCPPGLGCNDPHQQARKCLRIEARRIATVDELVELERTWSAFCGVPRHHKKARRKALGAYGYTRDGIVARALQDASDMIDGSRRGQLPQHLLPKGEVLDSDGRKVSY